MYLLGYLVLYMFHNLDNGFKWFIITSSLSHQVLNASLVDHLRHHWPYCLSPAPFNPNLQMTSVGNANDKIRPWAYDTTNTLVWFPPSEYRLKKESGEKPDSIRLLYPDDHPCSTESDTVPRKLSYVEFRIRIVRNCTEAIILGWSWHLSRVRM